MKEIWGVVKRARSRHLFELISLCLKNIRLVWPTYRATTMTIAGANAHYGMDHRRNTPANAFRHGLWNWLIAQECCRAVKNEEKVIRWTEKITVMHEKILPGNDLSNAMDLHNNAVGRWYFQRSEAPNYQTGIALFKELAASSRLVKSMEDIQETPKTAFVHLIDS